MARWLMLAAAGGVGGLFLGEMAAQNIRGPVAGAGRPYTGLSANPDAMTPTAVPQDSCLDCPNSYGVAVRLRTEREARMGHTFRELGAVDADMPPIAPPADDYRYGGAFPDEASNSGVPAEPPARATADSPSPGLPEP